MLLVLLPPLLLLASRGPRCTIRNWNIQHYREKLLTGNQAWRTLLLIRDTITQGVCSLFRKIISLQQQSSINLKIYKKMLLCVILHMWRKCFVVKTLKKSCQTAVVKHLLCPLLSLNASKSILYIVIYCYSEVKIWLHNPSSNGINVLDEMYSSEQTLPLLNLGFSTGFPSRSRFY